MMEELRPVTVQDVLRARDERAARQQQMLAQYVSPLISLTMNIAGAIKYDADIHRAFAEGKRQVSVHLRRMGIPVLAETETIAFTGCEALWAVQADAESLKRQMCAIEEASPLGRLLDIDVLDADGGHLSRPEERTCLICSGPAKICARSRAHSAETLFARAKEIIQGHFQTEYAKRMARIAQQALLREALTTPKPGLVDCANNGAHQDMDLFSFADSASALGAYFEDCVRLGQRTASLEQLQHAGLMAEQTMLDAVRANTHKGAIFSLGILCYAAGCCGEGAGQDALLERAAELGRCFLRQMTESDSCQTGGDQQYRQYGLTGARGEAASGFRTVREISLPALARALAAGESINDASLAALVQLMARVQDSNVIRRAGLDGQNWLMQEAKQLAESGYTQDDLRRLDEACIQRSISPGGSADLLAVTWFLYLYSGMEAK